MITDKSNKINKIIMKKINNILIKGFYFINLILIILYLYPGSILGYFLYGSFSKQPQITRDFSISEILISSSMKEPGPTSVPLDVM